MKKVVLTLLVLAALLTLTPTVWGAENILLDSVDFGGTDDSNRDIKYWGRSVTDETGGGYGGIGLYGARLVWDSVTHGVDDGGNDAWVLLHIEQGAAKMLKIRHLDGIADDSFEVYVQHSNGAWVYVGHYTDQYSSEQWVTTDFDLSTVELGRGHEFMVKIVATGEAWSGFATYGQLAIDWIELYGNGKT